jgi:ADP-L-glycero-D-manno-heptose 6-epimerase
MKILVTGHLGFIGSHLYKHLAEKHDVSGYDWSTKFPNVRGYDWVIHAGAISSTTEKDIEKVFRQNYDFSVKLLQQCEYHGVNLQYSSSASVYGLNSEYSEDSPVDPRTPYAWSKYLFERHVQKLERYNIVQGFRYFNVYGPGEEHKGTQASPYTQFRKQFEETGVVKVFKNSENYHRDFIHVDDIVRLHEKFLSVKDSGIWNFGTGTTKSFLDVAKSITENIVEVDMPEVLHCSYQKYTCANLAKLNETLLNNQSDFLSN